MPLFCILRHVLQRLGMWVVLCIIRGCRKRFWAILRGQGFLESGEWRVESGELRVESGEWRVESGELRVESGEWRVESGEWRGCAGG